MKGMVAARTAHPCPPSDWVFRTAGGSIIEGPPLELPPPPGDAALYAWVATLWTDITARSGWAESRWLPAERGWQVPSHLAVGDVLEFGLVALHTCGGEQRVVPGWECRWYGWLRYLNDLAAVVEGPFENAAAAAAAASATVAEIRMRQLPQLDINPSWTADELTVDIETEQ